MRLNKILEYVLDVVPEFSSERLADPVIEIQNAESLPEGRGCNITDLDKWMEEAREYAALVADSI